jgi:isoquinoline 1-oxidoreductase beta subunit
MPVPLAAWRAVTSTTLAFSHECFIDEMAHAAKKDGMAFRLEMLTKDSDTKNVLKKLKEVIKIFESHMLYIRSFFFMSMFSD